MPFYTGCYACESENTADVKFCNQCGIALLSAPGSVEPMQQRTELESRFHALIPVVAMWLQRAGRLTYRTLKWTFGIDHALLEEMRKELTFMRLAMDEDGEGLVWTGRVSPDLGLPITVPSSTTTVDHTAIVSSPATTILPTSTITKTAWCTWS